jgi:hypothetical protein
MPLLSVAWDILHLCFFLEMTLRFCVGHAVFLPTTLVVVGFGSQLLV